MVNVYCTIISKPRLFQGLAMYDSLKREAKDFRLYILCMDEETLNMLQQLRLDFLIPISVHALENNVLLEIKQTRTITEYCFTLKPTLLLYILNSFDGFDRITYVDADIYFLADPRLIFRDHDSSVVLSRHDYVQDRESQSKNTGKYNSGFISFRRDRIGFACLSWWQQKCNEWCYVKIEDGKYGDQKYLEEFPILFQGVQEVNTPGVNIAFWNHGLYRFTKKDEKFYINEHRLICYHFAYFTMLSKTEYKLNYGLYIYLPIMHDLYSKAVKDAINLVESIDPVNYTLFLPKSEPKLNDNEILYMIKE